MIAGARNINAELRQYNRQKAFHDKIAKKQNPFVRCPECAERIPHDFNIIQRHFLQKHKIADNRTKKGKGWSFTPVKARAANPLSLNPNTMLGLNL